MTSAADLLPALLARVASAGLSARRARSVSAPDEAMRFVLDYVQTTILPRQLKVFVDNRSCLTVVASGGRLVEVLECEAIYGRGHAPRLVDVPDQSRVVEGLRSLFADASHIAIVPLPSEVDQAAALHGIPAKELLRDIGDDPREGGGAPPIDLLIAAAEDVTLAVWQPEMGAISLAPDFDLSGHLEDWLGLVFETVSTRGHGRHDDELFLIGVPNAPELSACCHLGALRKTALLIHRDAATDVAEYWATLDR